MISQELVSNACLLVETSMMHNQVIFTCMKNSIQKCMSEMGSSAEPTKTRMVNLETRPAKKYLLVLFIPAAVVDGLGSTVWYHLIVILYRLLDVHIRNPQQL